VQIAASAAVGVLTDIPRLDQPLEPVRAIARAASVVQNYGGLQQSKRRTAWDG
jgi:hypothetical protein